MSISLRPSPSHLQARLPALLCLLVFFDASAQTPALNPSVQVSQQAGSRIYRLSVSSSLTVNLPCAASKTIKVTRAQFPTTASGVPDGELSHVITAQGTGRKLALTDARCDADGSIVASAVALEPLPSAPTNLCALPYAKEKAAGCR